MHAASEQVESSHMLIHRANALHREALSLLRGRSFEEDPAALQRFQELLRQVSELEIEIAGGDAETRAEASATRH